MVSARTAAGAMIEEDTLNPHLGKFPYARSLVLPEDADLEE
jgi:hypothetical protein